MCIRDSIESLEKEYEPEVRFSDSDKVVTTDKIMEMINSGLCKVGSHTCNHVSLTSIPISEAENQASKSLEWLHDEIGPGDYFFCYPHGHFNDEVRNIVKKYGYIGAVTTVKGDNILMDDVFSINRNPVNMEDLNRFRIIHNL